MEPKEQPDLPQIPWEEISTLEMDEALTFLFYGCSGSGKTYLAGQFPNNLILACDPGPTGGAKSALLAWERLGLKWNKPKIVRIRSYDELSFLLPRLAPFIHTKNGIDTLTVDSVSYLQKIVMSSILLKTGREIMC